METPPKASEGGQIAVRSLERHSCPNCGGKAIWNARIQQLECPYCATQFSLETPLDELSPIREHDLHTALSWLASLKPLKKTSSNITSASREVQCNHCHAIMTRGIHEVAKTCDFCGAPELLDYQSIEEKIPPESLLPAKVDQNRAQSALSFALKARWFAPNDLKKNALVQELVGIYLPYWTFDAHADCPWTAESGTYYYESVHITDSKGNSSTQQVRKTRWKDTSGRIEIQFDDWTIPASLGASPKLLRKIEPFPTKDLVPYQTAYISGWNAESYQVELPNAASMANLQMQARLKELCAKEVPGDTYRNLAIFPQFSQQTYKHILVPVWILHYRYRGKLYQSLVNGYTGDCAIEAPISYWKVAFAALIALSLFWILFHLNQY